ncbi:MAG: hypothetical protein QOF27_655, partial [Gaiellaceae bacterium]|nr:hypothetical protein [Gaiellaceae bacterium]
VEATHRGPHAQESVVGADLLAVLNVDCPNVALTKGFLVQAKSLLTPTNMTELRQQCERMHHVTPDSFVFLYDSAGVGVIPASPQM